ncbi:hypothetical protein N7467_006517 [Penicillium canescens]|nr:hypothetical protein N7467_006517 [Penicillium canescens]
MEQETALKHGGRPSLIDTTGLCLLSLDGGGVRGLSSLYILKIIMDRLNKTRRDDLNLPPVKPCEVFDLIGGTSTGGLIAIMLGRLEMDVDRCIEAYSDLTAAVFDEKMRSLPVNFKGDIKPLFNSTKLESAIKKVVEDSGVSKDDPFDNGIERGCKTFVCTADRDTKDIVRLRSYSLSHERSIRATICEAALATSAATTFFEPVTIGDRSFADGGLGANNPVDEVEGEASNIWCPNTGDLKPLVKCFISIGTGHPGIKPFEDSMFKFLGQTLVHIATETESTERRFMARWARFFDEGRYFRFNVEQGLQDIGLEEYKKKGSIESATDHYLNHTVRMFQVRNCIQNIKLKENKSGSDFATVIQKYTITTSQSGTKIANDLSIVPYASRAAWNSRDRESCLPGTRIEVQNMIRAWMDSDGQQHIFWLAGWPGTGKSTIATTVARDLDGIDDQHWMASFFFSRGDQETGLGEKFSSSIARQLCSKQPKFRTRLEEIISEDQQVLQRRSLTDQWKELIIRPISRLDSSSLPTRLVIVVDALDECESDGDICQILQLLADPESAFDHTRLRVLITSTQESRIRDSTEFLAEPDLVLQRVAESTVNRDIRLFIRHKLSRLDLTDSDIEALVRLSAGVFIWADAACRRINQVKGSLAIRRLRSIAEDTDVSFRKNGLDGIYLSALESCLPPGYSEEEKKRFRRLLMTLAVLLSPLSKSSLGVLLNISQELVHETLDYCHSILDLPPDKNTPLKIHHPSFRDFLLNSKRCLKRNFWVCEKEAHRLVFQCCVDVVCKSLTPNMSKKQAPGTTVSEASADEFLSPEVQYACLYWILHLRKALIKDCDLERVRIILEKHFLHWIEVLSWMGKISEAISSLFTLTDILWEHSQEQPVALALSKQVDDASRFIRYHRVAIETSPLQLYSSSLIFSPRKSLTRHCYEKDRPSYVLNEQMIENDWSLCLHTLEGHGGLVTSIAWSPESGIASASGDGRVTIWDSMTGQRISTIEGLDLVTSVAWSHDGSRLAIASEDGTVRIGDPVTGKCVSTNERFDSVTSVSWSQDGGRLLLVLREDTIKIWDLATKKQISTPAVDRNLSSVSSIAWSQDGSQLVSSLHDNTTKIWDPMTGQCMLTLEGHGARVSSIAWSQDMRRLASVSDCRTIEVWSLVTKKRISNSQRQHARVKLIVWSQDGSQLASASDDLIIRIWNLDGEQLTCMSEIKGHCDEVTSIAWSKDGSQLASASMDGTVKVWDLAAGKHTSATDEGHLDRVTSITWSKDGSRVASASKDGTVKIWDPSNGKCISTPREHRGVLEGHHSSVKAIVWSQDGSQVASISAKQEIGIWNTKTGQFTLKLPGDRQRITSIAWSKEGNRLKSAFKNGAVKIWDLVTGKCMNNLGEDNFDLLHINIGLINLELGNSVAISFTPSVPLPELNLDQSVKDASWINDGKRNLLWLPPDYRPSCPWATFETTIAIGCASGRVLVLKLPEPKAQ